MVHEQTTTSPRPFMTARAPRCAHCHRELPTGEGTDIPFVGVVGPECVKKYASLRRALETAHGMQAFEWDRGTFVLAHHVVMDLRRAGVAVEVVDVRDGVKEVRIKGLARKPKVVIESWKQIQARFEQRLRDAQAEREANGDEQVFNLTNPVTGVVNVPYRTGGQA